MPFLECQTSAPSHWQKAWLVCLTTASRFDCGILSRECRHAFCSILFKFLPIQWLTVLFDSLGIKYVASLILVQQSPKVTPALATLIAEFLSKEFVTATTLSSEFQAVQHWLPADSTCHFTFLHLKLYRAGVLQYVPTCYSSTWTQRHGGQPKGLDTHNRGRF